MNLDYFGFGPESKSSAPLEIGKPGLNPAGRWAFRWWRLPVGLSTNKSHWSKRSESASSACQRCRSASHAPSLYLRTVLLRCYVGSGHLDVGDNVDGRVDGRRLAAGLCVSVPTRSTRLGHVSVSVIQHLLVRACCALKPLANRVDVFVPPQPSNVGGGPAADSHWHLGGGAIAAQMDRSPPHYLRGAGFAKMVNQNATEVSVHHAGVGSRVCVIDTNTLKLPENAGRGKLTLHRRESPEYRTTEP